VQEAGHDARRSRVLSVPLVAAHTPTGPVATLCGVTPTLDADLLWGWARAALRALEQHRAEIDRINVFPVADRDTGTNLVLTMRSAVDAVQRRIVDQDGGSDGQADPGAVAAALARGALVGARGNSGVILSQVLRGLADALTD